MTTIKSYTDINQSKRLAKILPLESADLLWEQHFNSKPIVTIKPWTTKGKSIGAHILPCWSLAALLEIIPRNLKIVLAVNDYWDGNAVKYKYAIGSVEHNNYDCYADNHVDACYELIIKLHEQNLL